MTLILTTIETHHLCTYVRISSYSYIPVRSTKQTIARNIFKKFYRPTVVLPHPHFHWMIVNVSMGVCY